MPSINSVLLARWRVDNGPPRSVQFVSVTPYHVYVPDGATMNDSMIVIDYILNQPAPDQPALLQDARRGLITLATTAKPALPVPAVPPP
jgi:hypothetical protein